VEIGPLLAGAGVAGFALGFGAQNLIKDFIAGIFIVLENQYRVGDIIKVKGVGGRVIKLTTRITVLRDLDGNVHYIPNGSIEQATNLTMEYAKINMDISVSYESDLDKVKDVVNDVGLELSKDEEWKDYITDAPYFARVSALGDSAVIIKIFGKVLPAKQWAVEGELRKRLKMAFDKNNIRIPYPQLTIHQAKKPAKKN
jgi:small conductance mechanosensitive channel